LRDRDLKESYRMFIKWLMRLAKRLDVVHALVQIRRDNDESVVVQRELSDLCEIYSRKPRQTIWIDRYNRNEKK